MKRRKKRRKPAKEEISATEIAERGVVRIPKEIIYRVYEDLYVSGSAWRRDFVIRDRELFFEEKYVENVRHAALRSIYYRHWLQTEELPALNVFRGFGADTPENRN
jgi:hypothetical protein